VRELRSISTVVDCWVVQLGECVPADDHAGASGVGEADLHGRGIIASSGGLEGTIHGGNTAQEGNERHAHQSDFEVEIQ